MRANTKRSRSRRSPGDTLVLYSDGITDHLNAAGTEYGRGRLAQVVRSHCSGAACDLIATIFGELDKFSTTRSTIRRCLS